MGVGVDQERQQDPRGERRLADPADLVRGLEARQVHQRHGTDDQVDDVADEFEPRGFLCADPAADPLDVRRWFVRRWSVEVTFAEVRRHLGVETQRQWSDLGIARTTPALPGLFSLVTLWAEAGLGSDVPPRGAAWYPKPRPTFSDALATVRYRLWTSATFSTSPGDGEFAEIPACCWSGLPTPPATRPKWPKSSSEPVAELGLEPLDGLPGTV